ncbi:hypothetical protein [Microbispora oryzae]|nr:hypothetical protein [Microbispora oryzae]
MSGELKDRYVPAPRRSLTRDDLAEMTHALGEMVQLRRQAEPVR